MKINLLDLFSGIGGFHLGLSQAGFKINSYYSEIDKYAIKTYNYNFKNSTYVGSVTNIQRKRLPKRINAITFGSPCQDFSLAGKRKGLDGDRSSLIGEAINLISELKPDFFIWENVKGTFSSNNGEDFWAIIKAFTDIGGYRLEWQLLNTSWFLPQNRERIYLVGYTPTRSRGQIFPIGEISKNINEEIRKKNRESTSIETQNTRTINSRMGKSGNDDTYIKVKSATKRGYELATPGDSVNLSQPNSKTRRGRVGKQQAQTLETSCNQAVIGALRSIDRRNKGKKRKLGQQLEVRKDGNSNTLTSVEKDNYVIGYSRDKKGKITNYHEKDEANTIHSSSGGGGNTDQFIKYNYGQKSLNETLEKENISNEQIKALDLYNKKARDDSPTLTEPHHNSLRLFERGRIRRLTPIECERLQGFPDNWTLAKDNSDTQRYKMCGNAVTVDVVKAVGERIIKTLY